MTRLHQFCASTAVFVIALVPPPAHGGGRGDASHALVVCARQRNAKAVTVRAGQCRPTETAVPLDADTLQGLTAQQLLSARVASPDAGGTPGLSLVDAVGQFVGYMMMVGDSAMVVRPSNSGLVALALQPGPVGDVYMTTTLRGLKYFYESADCSGQALLINHFGGTRPVIREAFFDGTQLVYPGTPMIDPAFGPTVHSYSRPKNDETGTCSHDDGDPVSVPVGDRCCFSPVPAAPNGIPIDDFKPIFAAGPLVTEPFPTFVEPLHIAGF